MTDAPDAVLFACSHNAVRSPMAEAMLKHLQGGRIYVDSVGVFDGEVNGFAAAVMEEIGLSIAGHHGKTFDELEDSSYDLIITFSPEAHHRAIELTRAMACEVEYWPTLDPAIIGGSREACLDGFRQIRDHILRRLRERFLPGGGPTV